MRDIHAVLGDALQMVKDAGISTGNILGISVNKRLTRAWGQCRTTRKAYGEMTHCIEIQPFLLDERVPEKTLMEVIIHEILHTCEGCQNHGREWKRLAGRINRKYGYSVERIVTKDAHDSVQGIKPDRIKSVNHMVKCKSCGHVFKRNKASSFIKNPSMYRCSCGANNWERLL